MSQLALFIERISFSEVTDGVFLVLWGSKNS